MSESPTHRLVKTPKVNSRYLSDYMVASERMRRTIIRDCKYRKIASATSTNAASAPSHMPTKKHVTPSTFSLGRIPRGL